MSELNTKTETRNLRYDFSSEEIRSLSMELANKTKEKTLVEEEKASVNKQYGSRLAEINANLNKLAGKVSDGFELREVKCEITYHKPETGQKTILRTDTNEEIIEKMEPFEFNLFNQPKDEKDPDEKDPDEDGFEMQDEFESNNLEEQIDPEVASGAKNVEADSGDPVIELIKRSETNGLKVKLPAGELDKELFAQVKAKMEEIGGVWKGGRTQAFVFEKQPDELIWSIISKPHNEPKNSAKRTPAAVAEKMVSMVEIGDWDDVLIPCAASGELLEEVWKQDKDKKIDVYELDESARKLLLKRENPVSIEGHDILNCESDCLYEVSLCHPPLTDQRYIPIIKKIYEAISFGGTLVALTHPEWTTSRKKNLVEFRNWLDEVEAYTEEIPETYFQETGEPKKAILIKITKA